MRAFFDLRSGRFRRSTWLAPVLTTVLSTSAFGQLAPPAPAEATGEAAADTGAAPSATDADARADGRKDTNEEEPSGGTSTATTTDTSTASTGAATGTGSAGAADASGSPVTSPRAEPSKSVGNSASTDATDSDSDEADNEEKAPSKPLKVAEPKPDYSALPWTYHQRHLDLAVGLAFYRTADTALVPFLEAPVLVEGLVRAGGVLFSSGLFSLAALGEFGGSQGQSEARSVDTSIRFLHLAAGVEPRVHLHPRVFVYGRVMAGSEHSTAKVGYDGASNQLKGSSWSFRVDGNLGAAVRLAGSPDGRKRSPRLWAFVEGGYNYTTDHRAELEAKEEDAPPRTTDLEIEPYSSRGARGSLGLMTTF